MVGLLSREGLLYVGSVGTFKISPKPFYQVLVMLGRRADHIVPLFFVLLANKRMDSYAAFFEFVKEACAEQASKGKTNRFQQYPGFRPEVIYMDYELGIRGAAKANWPTAEIGGCLYHLAALFKKRLQSANVLDEYKRDADFAQSARMILAMTHLPPAKLEKGFELLERILPAELQPVLTWFGDNYMGEEAAVSRIINKNSLQASATVKLVCVARPRSRTRCGTSMTDCYTIATPPTTKAKR